MSKPYELRVLDYLRNFIEVARNVKDIVKKIDPEAKVLVFGSVVRGVYTAASDIDILIVSEHIERKNEIYVEVYRKIEAPVELHIATSKQFESWYKRFIRENELIEV